MVVNGKFIVRNNFLFLKSGNSYKVRKYMNSDENEVFMRYNVCIRGILFFLRKSVKICFMFFILKVAFV